MALQEVIELSSGESDAEPTMDRRAILKPVVSRVVDALGGHEDGTYRMGDEVNGCLKDLKKLWRKDDTDDERTVARIFWETRVLSNDLIPILLATAGKGLVEDKRAIACADLMTAMTWPIDMAEELKELDDELDKGTDYTQLLQSHLHYKASILKPGVMEALFGIMLPPLAKAPKERQERDGQIINVVLHLIRNLAFIKDLPFNTHLSSDQAEFSSLQSKLIRSLSETHTLQLLLTIATNAAKDPLLNSWNTLVLEILYLLYRGVKPTGLTIDQAKQPTENLQRLLAAEDRTRRELARKATSRHSRFGTTIAVKLNPNKKPRAAGENGNGNEADPETVPAAGSRSFVLHRQQAINRESGSIMDMTKRHTAKKGNKLDEMSRDDNLSVEARVVLQDLAIEFVEACFNPFLSALLKDIRSERAKITEKDNLRLLFVTKWFLEFFLSMRTKEKAKNGTEGRWGFGLIAEVTERTWIVWVLKRMREAPKQWTELQTGIECLTQLLLLIDTMSSSDISDPVLKDAAEVLQQQLIYNGEVLDIAFESLRAYKPGTQSLVYLDTSIYLAYSLLKMLERWSKGKNGEVYVRKKKAKKRKNPKARYKEFSSSENMRRVVSLMHRQAVRVKAEGLFFKVSTLNLFKTILADQKSFPREQSYKDLVNLITFILRQFFKALAEEPFLAVEVRLMNSSMCADLKFTRGPNRQAFFPKNRGHWKQFSSWEPEEKSKREKKSVEDTRFPADVEVKKGYSWSDQLGIAVASLVDAGQEQLVNWTKDVLTLVIGQRQRIIEETDSKNDDVLDSDEDLKAAIALKLKGPSAEAMSKITDYHADEFEWYVPAAITPSDLNSTLVVINQFLETPIDLDGKKAAELLGKKRRRRRRLRSPSPDSDGSDAANEDEPKRREKKEKKIKEKDQYKSAQFIEDSDEEYGDIEAFLEKEKAMRERTERSATASGGARIATMKAHGTKKRRRKTGSNSGSKKRRGEQPSIATEHNTTDGDSSGDQHITVDKPLHDPSPPPPRPQPRPLAKRTEATLKPPSSDGPARRREDGDDRGSLSPVAESAEPAAGKQTRRNRLVISDDDSN
ncbi:hypothetical protein H0H81_003683 [Sphagnurus paluster]|uniref:Timeless N-terminal domain-containing protein n=1 Tax=Sphagnurus paluster TaxID=117069 RepID=A0A9P7FZG1_9AGAR|nr:hypothetical protein H0H81_003683 [Sphagnurus paluster]